MAELTYQQKESLFAVVQDLATVFAINEDMAFSDAARMVVVEGMLEKAGLEAGSDRVRLAAGLASAGWKMAEALWEMQDTEGVLVRAGGGPVLESVGEIVEGACEAAENRRKEENYG